MEDFLRRKRLRLTMPPPMSTNESGSGVFVGPGLEENVPVAEASNGPVAGYAWPLLTVPTAKSKKRRRKHQLIEIGGSRGGVETSASRPDLGFQLGSIAYHLEDSGQQIRSGKRCLVYKINENVTEKPA
jgi:hypothetical protein